MGRKTILKGKGGGPPRRVSKETATKTRQSRVQMPNGLVLMRMMGILWHAVAGTARNPVLKAFWNSVPLRQATAALRKIKRTVSALMVGLQRRGKRRSVTNWMNWLLVIALLG
nr:putative enchored capsid (core) protein [Louping ill virus]